MYLEWWFGYLSLFANNNTFSPIGTASTVLIKHCALAIVLGTVPIERGLEPGA